MGVNRQGFARAQQQIIDGVTSAGTNLLASASGSDTVQGVRWPLLPGQSFRVYNASAQCTAAVPNKVLANSLAVYLQLYDAAENEIIQNPIFLVGSTWGDGALMGGVVGAVVAADGDPLIEFAAGFLVAAENSNPEVGPPAFVQVFASTDATNTDAANPHKIFTDFTAVLSFFTR